MRGVRISTRQPRRVADTEGIKKKWVDESLLTILKSQNILKRMNILKNQYESDSSEQMLRKCWIFRQTHKHVYTYA